MPVLIPSQSLRCEPRSAIAELLSAAVAPAACPAAHPAPHAAVHLAANPAHHHSGSHSVIVKASVGMVVVLEEGSVDEMVKTDPYESVLVLSVQVEVAA